MVQCIKCGYTFEDKLPICPQCGERNHLKKDAPRYLQNKVFLEKILLSNTNKINERSEELKTYIIEKLIENNEKLVINTNFIIKYNNRHLNFTILESSPKKGYVNNDTKIIFEKNNIKIETNESLINNEGINNYRLETIILNIKDTFVKNKSDIILYSNPISENSIKIWLLKYAL